MEEKMQLLPFQQFSPDYNIIKELGRGASGICYHIVTAEDQQHYALKKIPIHLIQAQKLTTELTILRSVEHPNIIRLRHAFISKEFLYLLFDYQQERDLQKLIKQRLKDGGYPFPQAEIWQYLSHSLSALAYLHKHSIIHRDIKPSNLFINQSTSTLHVGDLGAAKMVVTGGENYTRVGTPLYLAPEIIKYQAYDEKVDVWSLGVTIYHMAALRPPFQHQNFIRLAQIITYEEPNYPKYFSTRLKNCLKEMLKKDPKQRPSAQELLDRYFVNPVQNLPEETSMTITEHSLSIEQSAQREQEEYEEEEDEDEEGGEAAPFFDEWNIHFSQLNCPQQLENPKQASKHSLHRSSIEEDNPPSTHKRVPSIRTLTKVSSRVPTREDEIRQKANNLSKSQLSDGDDTIILQVDPNEVNNFCGYYRESQRPSKIIFGQGENNGSFRMGRKSSLFKQTPESGEQQPSHFNKFKENRSSIIRSGGGVGVGVVIGVELNAHRRQQSKIGMRQKHGEMMSNLRPSHGHDEEEQGKQVFKPQIIVIDRKPLLPPLSESLI